ncbi:hypothetical protein K7G98_25795 [Saccharothrix sp. MB29]|nr:hypothetical protein [Saccharothrix longispora]MBY8851552.1 hypothetical protein [Saccharothrix sp. MB29]MDU0294662.1 hypothetical protein [Saccharothrix longispora]
MLVFGIIGLVMVWIGLAAAGVVRDPFARIARRHPNAPMVFMGVLIGGFLIGRPFPLFRQMFRDAAESGNPLYGAAAFCLQSLGNIVVLAVVFVAMAAFLGERLRRWFAEKPSVHGGPESGHGATWAVSEQPSARCGRRTVPGVLVRAGTASTDGEPVERPGGITARNHVGNARPQVPATEVERSAFRWFWVEVQAGVGEEGVDQLGSVLDPFEPGLHDRDQVVDAVDEGIAQAAFQM